MSGIGVGIGIGYGLFRARVNALVLAYIERVEDDGGTVFVDAKHIEKRLKQIACL